MNSAKMIALVDELEDKIDDLEDNLQPLLTQALNETTKKLPLLDRAKLHVVIVYAIESLIFSYLKLHGVDAKEHPVFRELTRIKQYFAKIKDAEAGPTLQERENMSLDKQAVARMIKHSLAGNKKIDLERAEAEARQRLLAKRKLKELETSMHEKADNNDSTNTDIEMPLAELIAAAREDEDMEEGEIQSQDIETPATNTVVNGEGENLTSKQGKKNRKRKHGDVGGSEAVQQGNARKLSKSEKRAVRKAKKEAKVAAATPG